MNKQKIDRIRMILRLVFCILLAIIVVYAIVKFIPDVVQLLKDGNEQEIEEYIRNTGRQGVAVLVALQVLQTITIVFPGIPIYMCSGLVYGKIMGTIICYITYVVSNVAIFLFSRRMGATADELFRKDKQSSVTELMNKTKHPGRLVAVLCVVPLIPNGIIPHIAAKTSLDLKNFFIAVALGCIPGIFLFVCCGELIMNGYFGVVIALCVVTLVLLVISLIFKKRIMDWLNRILARWFNKPEE